MVSNADSAWTYRHLVAPEHRRRWTDRRIERARYSMSLFVWYFGTRRQYPDVAHHTIVLGPRYRELLTDIFERKLLAEDFSLYLHRPTATDPSLAPDGCDAFYVLSPVPHLQSGTDWAAQAEPYRQAIEQRLEATLLPDLANQIVTSRLLTPQDFQDRLSSFRGAAFARAGADAERLVPAAQPQRRAGPPLPRRRRHPSRRRPARRAFLGPCPRFGGTPCRLARPVPINAAHGIRVAPA